MAQKKTFDIQFPFLLEYQKPVINDPRPFKVLNWGAQAGKTRVSLYRQAAWNVSVGNTRNLWVTRDYKFAKEEFRLAGALLPKELLEERNKSDLFYRLKNGSSWWFYSGLEPDAFRGWKWNSAVFNEAAYCKPEGWTATVSPRLRGWAIFNFTPKGRRNWTFTELWHKAGLDPNNWLRSHVTSYDNPTNKPKELALARGLMSDALFRQEILAEFISDFGQYFNPKPICWTGKFEPYHQGARYVAGLDWAEIRDFTALAIMRIDVLPRRLVYFERLPHMEYTAQIAPLVARLKQYGNPPCFADASESTANQLMRQAKAKVEDFHFTAQSKPFICDQLRVVFEQGQILMPSQEAAATEEQRLQAQWLADEISFFEPHFVGGRLVLGTRGEHHDDILMAMAMANEKARAILPGGDDQGFAYLSVNGRGRRF